MKSIRMGFIILVALVMAIPTFAQTSALVELVGAIESTTATTITINGLTIDISSAELNTTLELDKIVEVEGTLLADGTIQAREVDLLDDDSLPGEVELVGILESFEATTMIIAGQSIDISTAEIYVGVVAGERVKVHAMLGTDGIWVAREVELFINTTTPGDDDDSNDDRAGEFEITGTLEQVGDGVIVVGGQTISTIGAEIKNVLVVGVRVKVHLSLVNGELVAREVENAFGDDDDSNDDNSNDDDSDSNDDNSSDDDNPNVTTAISADQAIQIVLGIYPNTTIVEIELDDKFDGVLVWEVKTSHGLELNIDAESGVILTIENDDDDRDDDSDDDRDDDRDDDNNSGNDDDRDDDNGGSNSGRGGDDDDDDDNDDDDDDDGDDD